MRSRLPHDNRPGKVCRVKLNSFIKATSVYNKAARLPWRRNMSGEWLGQGYLDALAKLLDLQIPLVKKKGVHS